jgi:hypothetical protein
MPNHGRLLVGSVGDDTFLFDLPSSASDLSGQADGGGGRDSLDYSLASDNVSVFLSGAAGEFLEGGFKNIEHVTGTAATSFDDILFGADIASTWTVSGAQAGTVSNTRGTLTYTESEALVGGDSADVFVIEDSVTEIVSIKGGGGANTIDLGGYQADLSVSTNGGVTNPAAPLEESILSDSDGIDTYIGGMQTNTVVSLIESSQFVNAWGIIGSNQIKLIEFLQGSSTPPTTFLNFGQIIGGGGRDLFSVTAGGSLSVGITGSNPASFAGDTSIDSLSYEGFNGAVVVDLVAGTGTGIPSIAGIDVVKGGPGNDSLTGLDNGLGSSLFGNGGNDTLIGGMGDFVFNGGNGDDQFVLTPNGTNNVIDFTGDGNDRIDFRNADLAIQFNADTQGSQTINSRGDTLIVTGKIEDVIGTDFADTITAGPLNVPRFLDGRNPPGPGEGDTLIFDAGGGCCDREQWDNHFHSRFRGCDTRSI